MEEVIKVTGVNFILMRPDGKILLQKRDDNPLIKHPGKWCFPGGSVEEGEDIIHALIREIKEETGLDASSSNFKFLFDFSDQPNARLVGRFFLCNVNNDVEVVSNEGTMEWKTLEEVEELDFAVNHKKLILELKKIIR